MALGVLFLLLLHTSACGGFGFKSCSLNFPSPDLIWCFNQNIANLTAVLRTLPDNATAINLCKNRIGAVPPASFSRMPGLKLLDLSQNRLVSLRGGGFRGLAVLESLNLTCNNISRLHAGAFEGLAALRTLLLTHNALAALPPGLFGSLPAILEVRLSLNRLTAFGCQDSGGSATLARLDLALNDLRRLNASCFPALESIWLSNNSRLQLRPDAFASNPRLRTLLGRGVGAQVLMGLSAETRRNLTRVSFSLLLEKSPLTICGVLSGMERLQRVEVDLKGSRLPGANHSLLDCDTPPNLVIEDADLGSAAPPSLGSGNTSILHLINCGLKRILRTTFQGYGGLKTLRLDQNPLAIQGDAFHGLARLQFLSFDRSRVRDVDPAWFLPLRSLTRLSLMKNEITALAPQVFGALAQLEQLYLQFNLLKYISRQPFRKLFKLKKLNLSLNIIDFIEVGTFRDLTSLTYLDLSGNRIKRLTPMILAGLVSLRNFVLYNNRLHFMSYEAPFINLTALEYLEMNYQGPGGRGLGVIGPRFFQGQSRLIWISMGHSIRIDFHPDALAPLVRLRSLYIAGVVMKTTNLSAVLSPMKNLKKLTLCRADLDALPADLMPPDNTLEVLRVQSNHLHRVDRALLDALPRLRVLDIRDNPLTCTCDNAWFRTWAIRNTQTQVSYLYSLHCDNDPGAAELWRFDVSACSSEHLSFALFVACSAADALLLGVCVAWHTHGGALRYLLLVLRARVRGRRRGAGAGAAFQYDAFVSYCGKDEAWVMEQLVPHLETPAAGQPRLRLCLHHRDFRPGAAVLDNIEAAILGSRRTICVVTRHFLRSDWCALEFQLAGLRLLCDGSDALLLLLLEDVPERCLSPYARVRKLVHKKTYLRWPDAPQDRDAFWVRLIQAVKDGEEEEEEEEGGGRGEHELG